MKKKRIISALVIFGILLVSGLIMLPAASQVTITTEDLGTLGGPGMSYANDINDLGQVVGGSNPGDPDPNGPIIIYMGEQAFIWSSNKGMESFEGFDSPISVAYGINNLGQVVGERYVEWSVTTAFTWTKQQGITLVGTLGGTRARAASINDLGQIVGESRPAGKTHSHAFIWTSTDGMIDLGTFGGPWSGAEDINELGQVVGDSEVSLNVFCAFIINPMDLDLDGVPDTWYTDNNNDNINDLMIDLGTLPDGSGSGALAINDLGDVVGYSVNSEGERRAVLWTSEGEIIDIDPGYAWGINNFRQVVGFYYEVNEKFKGERAWLWTAEDGIIYLSPLTGSTFCAAKSINNLGQVVGFSGKVDGDNSHPVLWTITEPPEKVCERIKNAQDRIQLMVSAGKISQGHARALNQKLEALKKQIPAPCQSESTTLSASSEQANDGDTKAAINILNAFKNQVEAYMKAGILSQEDGELLINDADLIILGLGV